MSMLKDFFRRRLPAPLWALARRAKAEAALNRGRMLGWGWRCGLGPVNRGVREIVAPASHPEAAPLEILVLKLDHLGDLLLAWPALRRLRERFPTAAIDLVCGSWSLPLARKMGIFRGAYAYDFFERDSERQAGRDLDQERELLGRLGTYDIALDLRRHPETRFLLPLIRAKLRAGYRSFSAQDAELDVCLPCEPDRPRAKAATKREHVSVQLLRLVEALPLDAAQVFPLANAGAAPERAVGIFPAAGTPMREWPLENFADLCRRLRQTAPDHAIRVYLAAGQERWAEAFRGIPGAEIRLGLELGALIDETARLSLVVANNSFGAHLAANLRVPWIAIYSGQVDIGEWRPMPEGGSVLHCELSCAPCYIGQPRWCPYDLLCLRQIPVETVLRAAMKRLEAVAG